MHEGDIIMMKGLTLRRIADACGGILHIIPGKEALEYTEVESITTDSRQAGAGSVFAAIKGERVDGHRFIDGTFSQGAAAVITEQDLPNAAGCWIRVRSTLDALKDIAEEYLRILQIPVVGITGSVGKTSTKEMVASVLSVRYQTLKTAGNFNNELGLPLTVFRLREGDEMAVLEMGINHFGEMHRLAKVARPDTCVITNIGQCHLEFLQDRDGVLRAKTEIFDFIDPVQTAAGRGHIVLNGNDDKLRQVQNVKGITPTFVGLPEGSDGIDLSVWADEIESKGLQGSVCRIHMPEKPEGFVVHVPIPGRHMIMNALTAAAVGRIYGLTAQEICRGIESIEAVGGRFHIIHTDRYEIVDDCYNANPVSMKASLDILGDVENTTVAILGDMGELGPEEKSMHAEVGVHAAAAGLNLLIGIGDLSEELVRSAQRSNPGLDARHFADVDAFLAEAGNVLPDQATILVKASHFMNFSRIVDTLRDTGDIL